MTDKFYVKAYAIEWDQIFQTEVAKEEAREAFNNGAEVKRGALFIHCPILPRYRSEWSQEVIDQAIEEMKQRDGE